MLGCSLRSHYRWEAAGLNAARLRGSAERPRAVAMAGNSSVWASNVT